MTRVTTPSHISLRHAGAVIVAVFALLVAGCSGSSTTSNSAAPTTNGTFPQTVSTAFGNVTIKKQPQRIVALGWGDAETVLALGGQPVGASDWLSFGGDGVGPWAAGMYKQSPKIIGTLDPSYEDIAALKPDLILDVKGSGDKARHDRLAQIATTVGIPSGGQNYLTTMEQQVTMIATAMGEPDRGNKLLNEIDQEFSTAVASHPQWQGKTVTAATRTSQGWGAYVEASERVQTLKRLGFVQNPSIASLTPDSTGFSVSVSSEQLDVFNADLIVAFPIFIDTKQITDDPGWKQLSTVQAGHAVVIDGDLANAYSEASVLSTKYTLDHLVPMLEKATS